MTCRELNEFLLAYLDDALDCERRRTFEEHLAACPPCQAYLESYKATIALGKAAFDPTDESVPANVPEELITAILAARNRKS